MRVRLAAAFFVLGLLTRLPLQTENLWAHDSLLYARGMADFDPAAHRPQPPGYLYYIWLLRAVDLATNDPNRAMTLVSAVAGAAAVALLYGLAARLYDERTGRMAALFLLTAVTFWAYGAVAYPYTLLAALTVGCAWLFWNALGAREEPHPARAERGRALVLASAAWGLAIGFRPDLALLLAPLWLMAALGAGAAWAAAAAASVALVAAGWLLLSAAASGGIAAFVEANRAQAAFVEDRYSVTSRGLEGLRRNAYELARYLGRGLYALLPLLGVLALSSDARRSERREPRRALFLALWTGVPLAVYLLVHAGEYGYMFSALPGLCVVAARGAVALAKELRLPRLLPGIAGVAIAANAGIFLLTQTPLSAYDLARRDHGWSEKVAYVRANVPPRDALVITVFDTILVEHHLGAAYPIHAHDPDAPAAPGDLRCAATAACANEVTIVVWEEVLRVSGPEWRAVPMPHGATLRIARVARDRVLHVREGLVIDLAR